jgi:hypothetical protein
VIAQRSPATSLVVDSVHGLRALRAVARELEGLEQAVAVPLTARVRWAIAAFEATPDLEPWALVARDLRGRPGAALVLSRQETPGRIRVGIPRPGTDDRLSLRSRSPHAVDAVVSSLAEQLGDTEARWTADLTGLPTADPAVSSLRRLLPRARVIPGRGVPIVNVGAGAPDVEAYLSRDVQRSTRRARRRLEEERVHAEFGRERRFESILAELPRLCAAHRARDHAAGRPSDLDRPEAAAFWRTVIEHQAARGAVELSTLRLNGELAAYVIAFVERPVYRVFDGHLVSRWARYVPGRLLEADVLARVLGDPSLRTLDWMTSVAPEKLIAATGTDACVRVVAAGGRDATV